MRIAKWISSAAVLIALFAFPLLAQYYVPIVEWNGTHFRVMNGSGSYDLQPVDSPVVDVPFSNPSGVAVWSDGTDIHTFVVDSYNDRVQFFDTQLTRTSHTEADFTWTAGAADEGFEFDDDALYLENTLGDVVRGSEKLTVGGVVYTRVSDLTGYTSTDNVYTITYEGADVDNSGIFAFPANTMESTDEFTVEFVESSVFNTPLTGELDYQVAAAATNGATLNEPFEINETIPDNVTSALAFENLVAITHVENQAAADIEDLYVLDAGEIGTVDPHLYAFKVEHDAAASFDWIATYDGVVSNPQDVAIAESGDNVLAALADAAGFTTWNNANGPDNVGADEDVIILNNAQMNSHTYTVTVVDAQDATGVDLDGITFSITDNTTGNLVGYYASTATVASETIQWNFLPWLAYTVTLGDGTGPGEDDDLDFLVGDDLVIDCDGGAAETDINEYIFICDTGNDRVKVLKGFDNNESGINYTAGATLTGVDPFADDTQRKDYYASGNANVANITFVSATRAMEGTFDLYTHSSVSGDSVEWTRVDNFAGSTDSDKHYMYNYDTQVIQFGDGEFGALPAATDSIFAYYNMCLDVLDYGSTGSTDGHFNQPAGITAKYNVSQGWYDVYVSDTGNDRIVKLKYIEPVDDHDGVMEWVTSWNTAYTGSSLSEPTGIDVHDNGTAGSGDTVYLFVCDTGNDRVVIYRDNDAEYEGDGGNTQPEFSIAFGGEGNDFGEFLHPEAIDVIYNNNAYEITVADGQRNYVVKYQVGDTPAIDVDYSNVSTYGYLPTSSYNFIKVTANDYMAQNYPDGSYIQFLYSDTTTSGQESPILCSNTQFPPTTTSFTWDIASTPTGAPEDGVYYLYATLYDVNGIELATDQSTAANLFIVDSSLLDGIGAFDNADGDAYLYAQNNSIRQFTLDVIYPDSVAAVSWSGTFPAEYMQILDVDMGTAFETVQNQGIIFEFDFDNTAGTWEVQSAVLGSNTGLVSGRTVYTIAVLTIQVDSDAISTASRFFNGTIDVETGTWADYKGAELDAPTLRDLNLRIGYLGDIADPNQDSGTAPNMIPNPDGIFGIDDIIVFSQAWNAIADIWDPIGDLAPFTGTVPNIWSEPDGVLDGEDLLAFTTMFDWYQEQTFAREGQGMPESKGKAPAKLDIVQNRDGDKLVVEIYANDVEDLMTTELQVYYNTENLMLEDYEDGRFLSGNKNSFFRAYERGSNLHIFNSRFNKEQPGVDGSGKLAVLEFNVKGNVEDDIVVSFDMRDVNGDVIENGSFSTLDLGDGQANLPKEFSLKQNFPNPFNPTTRIEYTIPEAAHVSLTVYNVLGEVVAELVNSHLDAGYHSVTWNAVDALNGTHQASGIYFYTLKAGKHTATKKMLLFK